MRPIVPFVTFGGGGAGDDRASGGALIGALTLQAWRAFIQVTPAEIMLTKGDSYPYYRDYFDNGESRCRNSLNGQFADDSDCLAVDGYYAFTLDGAVLIPRSPVLVGAGKRFDGLEDPVFGTVGFMWRHPGGRVLATIRANLGRAYAAGLATVSIRLGR